MFAAAGGPQWPNLSCTISRGDEHADKRVQAALEVVFDGLGHPPLQVCSTAGLRLWPRDTAPVH